MEDIIAIRIEFEDQPTRHVLTWGRIQDPVDPAPVERLVAEHMASRGRVTSCTVCMTLQEAAHTPYFYEALFAMAQKPIPCGDDYEAWRSRMVEAMRSGKELWDCGVPGSDTPSPD